jgi:hypothetical protein
MRLLLVLAVLLTATPAFACPQCALNDKAGLGSWFILGGMIIFPFFVVGGVLWAARRMAMIATEQENLSVGENRR